MDDEEKTDTFCMIYSSDNTMCLIKIFFSCLYMVAHCMILLPYSDLLNLGAPTVANNDQCPGRII